jgi:hypothetical protein
LPESFGQKTTSVFLPRRTLRTAPLSPTSAPQTLINPDLFYWSDDLPFDVPKNSVIRPTLIKTSTGVVTTSLGDYSWFFTVMPVATEMAVPVSTRRLFNVSAAVCYKRNFQMCYDPNNLYPNSPTTNTLDGEHIATISANTATTTGFPGMGIGGGTVQLDKGNIVNVKENQWVMLYHLQLDSSGGAITGYPQMNRCNWYRVLGVGKTAAATYINLSGPDWDPNLDAVMVVVPGVIGVYNTTMELDWDPLWTK